MEAGKTGALLSCSAAIGAILAGAPATAVDALADFGRHLGIAFQAVDDVLGIWGEPSVTGKPVGNDLRQHKKSLPVAIALSRGTLLPAGLGPLPRANSPTPRLQGDVVVGACGAREEPRPSERCTFMPPLPASNGCLSPPARARSWRLSPGS